jgi:hypothetical protein
MGRELEHETAVGTNGPGSAVLSARTSDFAASRTTDHSQSVLMRRRSQVAAKTAGEFVGFDRRRTNRALGEPRRNQVVGRPAPNSGMALGTRSDMERLAALQTPRNVTGLVGEQDAVDPTGYTRDVQHRRSLGSRLYDNRKIPIGRSQSVRGPTNGDVSRTGSGSAGLHGRDRARSLREERNRSGRQRALERCRNRQENEARTER